MDTVLLSAISVKSATEKMTTKYANQAWRFSPLIRGNLAADPGRHRSCRITNERNEVTGLSLLQKPALGAVGVVGFGGAYSITRSESTRQHFFGCSALFARVTYFTN